MRVVVAGLGAWGASTCWALARRGVDVIGIDPLRPPHDRGSHTGRTRLARRSAHEGAGYTAITARAFELWDTAERDTGRDILERTGALLLDQPDGPLLAPSRAVLEQGGWDYELLDGAEVAHRHPGVRLQPGEAALYEPGASVLHVDQAMRALHEQAAASGAELRTGCGLLGWQSLPGGVRARTTSGDIDAAALVLAVGHEAPALLGSAWPLEVERQVLATFELPRSLRHLPALFAVDPELGERSGFYGCPEGPDHGEYKVALHHGGLTGPPDTLPRQVLPEDWKQILEVVRRRVPALADAPVDAQACTYTNTPDHDWLLDVHPDDARVVVGTGDSGRGFRYAPAVGELLADLAQGRSADHPAFLRKERPRVA